VGAVERCAGLGHEADRVDGGGGAVAAEVRLVVQVRAEEGPELPDRPMTWPAVTCRPTATAEVGEQVAVPGDGHRVPAAMLLADAGTAADLAGRVDLGKIATAKRKAPLFIDVDRGVHPVR
jgi:hypothetical protein